MQQLLGEGLHRLQNATLQLFLNKVKMCGITTEDISIGDVLYAIDYHPFKKSHYNNHCLKHLLPDVCNSSSV